MPIKLQSGTHDLTVNTYKMYQQLQQVCKKNSWQTDKLSIFAKKKISIGRERAQYLILHLQ